ncbi:MAG: G1 family endopeptidase [Thermoplasmata archaeon]|nr:G1 family endopeptidase [Thermoplasmata archaeon]
MVSGSHASPATKTGSAAHPTMPNAAKLTALLHQSAVGATIHKVTSGNWAGYVNTATAGTIYEVTGEWFAPTTTCPSSTPSVGTYQVSWVGIDGWGTGTVEQDGTLAYCSGPGATPVYYDWWEFYPYNSVQFVSYISGGDFVQATVLYNPAACVNGICGVYTLSFADLTAQTSFQVVGNPSTCNTAGCEGGPDGSAECISEAPGVNGGIADVTDYKSTKFWTCADTIGSTFAGIGSHGTGTTTYEVRQIGGVTGLADQKPTSLVSYYYGLSQFTVKWYHYN